MKSKSAAVKRARQFALIIASSFLSALTVLQPTLFAATFILPEEISQECLARAAFVPKGKR
jgi:hypothetical protein